MWAFSVVAAHGLLVAVASLVGEYGLKGTGVQSLLAACGILLDQGLTCVSWIGRQILYH